MNLDVIVPVGPGHEQLFNEATQSVKIACLTGTGPFTDVRIKGVNDTEGEMGRSAARNHAIKASTADWLFFLDADDLMYPYAMESVKDYVKSYDAIWGRIAELHNGCILERYQMPVIERYDQILEVDPFYTLQMGFFVRREVMPLFDDSLNTGEDWKVYLKLWEHHRCIKQAHTLMINRRGFHSQGPKAATGAEWSKAVHQMIDDERKKLPA